MLSIGDPAPTFTLQTGRGQPLSLADYHGRPIVLYFYPKDDTPGCTKEACGFQTQRRRFNGQDAIVFGVSCDTPASHQRFAQKFGLTFPLLSDPEAAVAKAYGVYVQKSMYGRTYWGIERTTFIIDAQGRIAQIFAKVRVDGHTDEVLEAVKALAGTTPGTTGTKQRPRGTRRTQGAVRRTPAARA